MKKKLLSILAIVSFLVVGCGGGKGDKDTAKLTDIVLNTDNVQKVFEQNDTFNYINLVVTAYYTDETSKIVTNYTVSTPNMSLIGQQDVTVSYVENSISANKKYQITINEKQASVTLSDITLDTTNVKKEFEFGEQFSYSGLVVTASYSNGTSKTVTGYTITAPDMFTSGTKSVTVEYQEGNVSKSKTYEIIVKQPSGTQITEEQRQALLLELRQAYNGFDSEEYSKNGWKRIVDYFAEATEQIKKAVYLDAATQIKEAAIANMNAVVKQADVTKGTLFNYVSASSNYEFDRDENNNITISYEGYPGHWVHTGSNDQVEALAKNNNVFELTIRNDIAEQIEVCAQLTDGADYKADSQIVKVEGNETKTIKLEYDVLVTRFYFFVDSCSEHNRNGHITILGAKFSYYERPVEDRLYEPKDIACNVNIAKGEDGTASTYTLVEDDHPNLIERVSAVIEIQYNGATDSTKFFGFVLHAGSQKSAQLKDSEGYAQDHSNKEGEQDHGYCLEEFNLPLTAKLSAGSKIYGQIAYAADGLIFKVLSYRLHYCVNAQVISETVDVNTSIYENNSGFINGDKNQGQLTASIPYSSFENRGRVVKMDVKFTTINNESYGKSQIYFKNSDFTHFDSGNNNVLNIGPIMDTSKSGNPATGTVTVYPASNWSLKGDETITIVCWWASASSITVDSITMYTDVAQVPQSITALEAHPVDSGVVLTWGSSEYATSYDVYIDGVFHSNVTTSYATINGLTNGTTYTFGVVAKNITGSAEGVTTQGTPAEGATYDTFIEGLNTSLEEMIGTSGIASMFNAGNEFVSQSNNERLKSVINKMQNGQETTVAYMGGSITVGENATLKDENHHQKGYAYYSYQWLKRTYDVQNKSKFVNGSISGTGSEIGIVRLKEDILDYNPDLIFIEFAANNGSTDFYKQSFESLVRACLALPSNPAIVLTFSCTSYTLNGARTYMAKTGQHYSLPMFNFDVALRSVCTPYNNKTDKSGDPIWNAFSNDGTHPNDEGHQLYAKCLCYFLRTLITKATDTPAVKPDSPSEVGMDYYDGLVACNNTNSSALITSLGSFVAANTATPSTSQQSDVTAFQHGWKKTDTESNDAMTIEVTAKNFVLIYEAGNKSVAGDPTGNIVVTYVNKDNAEDTGTLTWDVSKTCKQTHSGSTEITDQSGSGWENPVAIQIFAKDVAATYIVTIQMETAAGICTIMAFGYTA